jgi:C1A family cysteine protease
MGVKMALENKKYYFGWLPDYPDFRDYSVKNRTISDKSRTAGVKDSVAMMIKKTGIPAGAEPDKDIKKPGSLKIPESADLRKWCSPVEDQGELGSCTANAAVSLVEYFEKKANNIYIDGSRLFLYKTTRNLLQKKGDYGAYIRTTIMALVLFGVVPEKYWKYDVEKFEDEPDAFCYSFAQSYKTVQYFRLDLPKDNPPEKTLEQIKLSLAAKIPAIFGFSVYSTIYDASGNKGKIPFPCETDKFEGGHAVMAAGYDDGIEIVNSSDGSKTKGAILIKNSWGKQWGDNGYGWLPYEYVLKGLAVDWWTILENNWVDTGKFKLD